MDRNHVVTPRGSRWQEFLAELGKAPLCHRTTEHARRVLQLMPGVDADASLEALAVLGGRCDCTILFDLDPDAGVPGTRTQERQRV
jgi:hypothetical protein